MNNYSLGDFKVKNYPDIGDHLFLISDGMPYKIPIGNISAGGNWNDILNKPFDDYDSDIFSLNAVTVNNEISRQLTVKPEYMDGQINNKLEAFKNSELNEIISLNINNFKENELDDLIDFQITAFKENVLGNEIDTKINDFKSGELTEIISEYIGETDVSGLDFNALSAALTGGIQNGISITADNENNLFNFTVNSMPEIGIDGEGYWTINGLRGENPTIAKGEKGDSGENGFTPIITASESADGINITITNSEGNTSVALSNGITPHIDSTNYHWFVGDEDTGICARGEITRDEFDELKAVIGTLNNRLENILNGGAENDIS